MYFLLILSAILFSSQFIFNQQYQKNRGEGIEATITFSAFSAIISFVFMLVLGGFKINFTWFSTILAFLFAIANFACMHCGLCALKTANLSVYSIFMMLGGMIIPFVYGILFEEEPLTITKIFCILVTGAAVALSFKKDENSKKAVFYYVAIFILNGLFGVISKIHQSNLALAVDTSSFMAFVWVFVFIICFLFAQFKRQTLHMPSLKEFGHISGYVFCNGIAQVLSLTALKTLPASVQYPIITGGVMVFSTLISLIKRENVSKKTLFATLLAFVATIIIML